MYAKSTILTKSFQQTTQSSACELNVSVIKIGKLWEKYYTSYSNNKIRGNEYEHNASFGQNDNC